VLDFLPHTGVGNLPAILKGCDLQVREKGCNSSNMLKQTYQKQLLPFEESIGGCLPDLLPPSLEKFKRKRSEGFAGTAEREWSIKSVSEEDDAQAAEIMTELKASKQCWDEPSPKRQRLEEEFGGDEVRSNFNLVA
jgi:hypothetical protein